MQETESLIEKLRGNSKLSKADLKTDAREDSIDKHLVVAKRNIKRRREILVYSVEFHEKAKSVSTKLLVNLTL